MNHGAGVFMKPERHGGVAAFTPRGALGPIK